MASSVVTKPFNDPRRLGHRLRTRSDSGVTLHLYEDLGAKEIADSGATLLLAEGGNASGDALVGYACFTYDDTSASVELRCIYVDTR